MGQEKGEMGGGEIRIARMSTIRASSTIRLSSLSIFIFSCSKAFLLFWDKAPCQNYDMPPMIAYLNPHLSPITNQCMSNIHSCWRAETLLPSPKKKIHGKKALFTHHSPMSLLKVWSWWWQNYSGRVTCFDIYPAAILLLPMPWSFTSTKYILAKLTLFFRKKCPI